MKYALIENGLVTQCSCRKIESYISCPDHVCPSYLYSNEEFTAPEPFIDYEEDAKTARNSALESSIEYDSVLWDIDANARDNIGIALRSAERSGLDDSESRQWRLADNTWRETTLAELKTLLELYDARFESIWTQYGVWDSGDKSEKFVIE